MKEKKAFTLIELMIAITIVIIVTMATYAPYNYYKNKAKLKNTASEITQLLYESRNKAVNWAVWLDWNVSIWVYFDSSELYKDKIEIFSYPHDINNLDIDKIEWWDVNKIDTIFLEKGVWIDNIDWNDNLLFVFSSISWDLSFYTWSWPVRTSFNDTEVLINFSYKWASSINLQKTVTYFTNTNIIDY